jgi:hypothetical protein
VETGAAGALGGSVAVAHRAVFAETTDPEFWILADARRRVLCLDDALRLAEQPCALGRIGHHPLDVDLVGLLADHDVHGARDAGEVQVDLDLRVVMGLGMLHRGGGAR